MEYVYAALILNEADEEINEENLTAVLEAASVDVEESRVKALVAALEDVDIDEAIEEGAAVPATAGAASAGAEEVDADAEPDEAEAEEAEADEDDGDDEDEEASGEGLGALFG